MIRTLTNIVLIIVSIIISIFTFIVKYYKITVINLPKENTIIIWTGISDIIFPLSVIFLTFGVVNLLSKGNGMITWLSENPVRYYIVCTASLTSIIVYFSLFNDVYTGYDVLVEAHGLIFDLIVLGILLSIYERHKEKKEKKASEELEKKQLIQRYVDEIDFVRDFSDKEARSKIISIAKRLVKLDYQKIDLSKCFLENVNFEGLELKDIVCNETILNNGNLDGTNLTDGKFFKAKMNSVLLNGSTLNGCDLREAELEKAILIDAKIKISKLDNAILKGAILINTNLSDSSLTRAILTNANLRNAVLTGTDLRKAVFNNANMIGVTLDNAKVSELNWLERMSALQIEGISQIENIYYVNNHRLTDEFGNPYYELKKKISHSEVII